MGITWRLAVVLLVCGVTGCASPGWVERRYAAPYDAVFAKVAVECHKCDMTLQHSDPGAGLITLSAYRAVDMALTGSPMVVGDDVFVKVTREGPETTQVWITSKSPWQIGPDIGRTQRNAEELAKVLDRALTQAGGPNRTAPPPPAPAPVGKTP